MSLLDKIKAQIQSLIGLANEKTGNADTDLTTAVTALAEGYGSGGSDESVWVEDNSPVIYVKGCYAKTNVEIHVTENGTAIYKRKYREGENNFYADHYPQWNYGNLNQVVNMHGEFGNLITSIEQAEIINLEDCTEGEKIRVIGQNTFACMSSLKRVRIPDTIETVEKQVFSLCYQLKEINLPNTVSYIGPNAFNFCTSLEKFDIPPLVTTLESQTFSNCVKLKKITGIERMTSIGANCFDSCVLLEGTVVLNEAISELGQYTFRSCFSLEKVIFLGTPTGTINTNVFPSCHKLKDIYVPWSEGEVANAPWGATKATIHYNTTYDENHNPIV